MSKVRTPTETVLQIQRLRKAGQTYKLIAKQCGVSEKTAKRYGGEVNLGRRGRRIRKNMALGIHHREDYEIS